MDQHIETGIIQLPHDAGQKQLHGQLGAFADWMQRTRDADEVQRDRPQPVPVPALPMPF